MKISLNSISLKISLNSEDPIFGLFWSISPIFGAKNSFSQKLQLYHAQLHKGLYHLPKLKEI